MKLIQISIKWQLMIHFWIFFPVMRSHDVIASTATLLQLILSSLIPMHAAYQNSEKFKQDHFNTQCVHDIVLCQLGFTRTLSFLGLQNWINTFLNICAMLGKWFAFYPFHAKNTRILIWLKRPNLCNKSSKSLTKTFQCIQKHNCLISFIPLNLSKKVSKRLWTVSEQENFMV